ncbi:MAG: VCBS repeat-containing protein [Planctomycetaceae bacterium]
MTAIGDVNGDGVNDLAISVSEQQSATTELPDTVYILHLNSDGTIKRTNRVGDQIEGQSFLPGSSLLASSMTFLGDSNGDGRSELVIGMPYFRGSDGSRPSVFVLPLLDAQSPSTPVAPTITGPGATTPRLRPTFAWAAVAGATEYEISVNRDRLNSVVLDRIVVTGTSYTPTIDLGLGKFNVGVRAKNVTGTSAWSLRYDFSVVSAVELLPAPDGLIRRPTLAWKEMPGASKYEIFVSDIRTPNTAVIRTIVSGALTTFVPSVDLAHGTYRLSVRASDVDGTVGQWSRPDDFTIGSSTTVAVVADQISRRPKLEWNVIQGAASYDIWITDTRNPAKPPVRTTTTPAFFVLDRDLPTGSYRAWVRGIAGTALWAVVGGTRVPDGIINQLSRDVFPLATRQFHDTALDANCRGCSISSLGR